MIKLKHFQAALEEVRTFDEPDYMLEQYKTSAHLAAQILYNIEGTFGDIDGKVVADFGCGTGVLGIGAQILGSRSDLCNTAFVNRLTADCSATFGFDIDPTAITIAQENAQQLEVDIDFVLCDVSELEIHSTLEALLTAVLAFTPRPEKFDTIIMNPPFGTRVKGIDMTFLLKAVNVRLLSNCVEHCLHSAQACAGGAVYSLHKSSTRAHILKTVAAWGCKGSAVAQLRFDIPQMYAFHRKKSVDVEVDLIRVEVPVDREIASVSAANAAAEVDA